MDDLRNMEEDNKEEQIELNPQFDNNQYWKVEEPYSIDQLLSEYSN